MPAKKLGTNYGTDILPSVPPEIDPSPIVHQLLRNSQLDINQISNSFLIHKLRYLLLFRRKGRSKRDAIVPLILFQNDNVQKK